MTINSTKKIHSVAISIGLSLLLMVCVGILSWQFGAQAVAATKNFVQGGNLFGELAILGTNDNFGLALETNNTEQMRIDTNGNIGIGTKTPTSKLHVVGTGNITGDTLIGGALTLSSLTAGSIPFIGSGGLISQDNANLFWDSTNKRLGVGTKTPMAGLQGVVPLGTFLWQDIGLDFNSKTNLLGVGHFRNTEEPFYGILMQSTPDSNILSLGGDTSSGNAATEIRFWTAANNTTLAGTERMEIDSKGNVGIGTFSPNAKLQIAGGDAAITTQGNGMILKATDGPNCYRVTVNNAGTLSSTLIACP